MLTDFVRPRSCSREKESEISLAEKKKTVADRKLTAIESVITQDKEKVKEKQIEVKCKLASPQSPMRGKRALC